MNREEGGQYNNYLFSKNKICHFHENGFNFFYYYLFIFKSTCLESHYSGFNSTAALWISISQKRLTQLPLKSGAVTHRWKRINSLWADWLISQTALRWLQTMESFITWCCLTSEWNIKQQDAAAPHWEGVEKECHVIFQECWAENYRLVIHTP